MPRRKRAVVPGIAHHVTQRGGRRQNVFFNDDDYRFYLLLLSESARRCGVDILSYCLMTNHVHHLLVPMEADSLRWTLQMTHKRYADHINAREGWTGHLWQQRFYSCPVDEDYLWVALRYIQRNPVKAGMVQHAVDYGWSSAAAHCGLRPDSILTDNSTWVQKFESRNDWCEWLAEEDEAEKITLLRNRTSRDLPMGSESFLDQLEREYGVVARPPKLGRPKKEKS